MALSRNLELPQRDCEQQARVGDAALGVFDDPFRDNSRRGIVPQHQSESCASAFISRRHAFEPFRPERLVGKKIMYCHLHGPIFTGWTEIDLMRPHPDIRPLAFKPIMRSNNARLNPTKSNLTGNGYLAALTPLGDLSTP